MLTQPASPSATTSKASLVPKLKAFRHVKLTLVTVLILFSFILHQCNYLVRVAERYQPHHMGPTKIGLANSRTSSLRNKLEEESMRRIQDIEVSTEVGLCAIVKEVERYLDEWVDYNFGIGFHSIYIYDNSNNNDLKDWGERRKRLEKNLHVRHYPGIYKQKEAYNDCVESYGQHHTWLAFFDHDEFLVLKKHDSVTSFLKDHLPAGVLTINWYIFGTSNHTLYAPLPVTRRFLYRDPEVDHRVKSILKVSDYGGAFINPHNVELRSGKWIDTNGGGNYSESGASNNFRPNDVAVLHHYKYKSTKEWNDKGCILKGITGRPKECGDESPPGTFYDDSAWVTLKRNVPKYQVFDDWEDYS